MFWLVLIPTTREKASSLMIMSGTPARTALIAVLASAALDNRGRRFGRLWRAAVRRRRWGHRDWHGRFQWPWNQRLRSSDPTRSRHRAADPVREGKQHGTAWACAVRRSGTERRVVLRLRLSRDSSRRAFGRNSRGHC